MNTRRRSKKINRAWLHDHINDPYVKRAQAEGYRSRAAYKLKEIDEALHLLQPGQFVVDLGSAPGAWSQYVRRKFTSKRTALQAESPDLPSGRILALDMLPMEAINGVRFHLGDFREEAVMKEFQELLEGQKVDVVLSDMAPNLAFPKQTRLACPIWWNLRSSFRSRISVRVERCCARRFTAAATASWRSGSRRALACSR
jgi:23S rRNA (uridine2552-2'-O)-methyltransferase